MKFEEFHARGRREIEDPLTEAVIGAAIEVHKELGPGVTEEMYETAVCHELDLRKIAYERQVRVPVFYKGKEIGIGRIDLIVEGRLIVELKACEALGAVHRAQVITYLRITGLQLGLLINFNVAILKDGVRRVVLTA